MPNEFPIINYHKLGNLKPQKCASSPFWKSEVQIRIGSGLTPSGGSEEESAPCCLLASAGSWWLPAISRVPSFVSTSY